MHSPPLATMVAVETNRNRDPGNRANGRRPRQHSGGSTYLTLHSAAPRHDRILTMLVDALPSTSTTDHSLAAHPRSAMTSVGISGAGVIDPPW